MKLSVKDRVIIANLYPKQADIMTQIIVKGIVEKVQITSKEMERISLKVMQNIDGTSRYTWDDKKCNDIDADFTEAEIELLKSEVDKMDKEKRMTMDMLDLSLKIRDYKQEAKKDENNASNTKHRGSTKE